MGVVVLTITVDEDENDVVLVGDELEREAGEIDGVTGVSVRIEDET